MSQAVPEDFWQGVDQFNQRQFYACHDTLEALWMEAREPQKTFYQGILQIAVALHHLGNRNWRGSVILLGEGINKLRRYSPTYTGIDVEELLTSTTALLTALQAAGPEKVGDWVISRGASTSPSSDYTITNGDQTLQLPNILRAD